VRRTDEDLRQFERAMEQVIVPGVYIVARLDGRGFSKLTLDRGFDKPFDPRFRDAMVQTTEHLMDCGAQVVLGYTQSDEISLLLHPRCSAFGRRATKLSTVLAGEGSARLTLAFAAIGDDAQLGAGPGVLDCRLSVLPGRQRVVDYFLWRIGDAVRNGLNAHVYWALRNSGVSAADATERLSGMKPPAKHDLLHSLDLNWNDVPSWQKQGIGLSWERVDKPSRNPITGETVVATRRRLVTEMALPVGNALVSWLEDRIPEM